VRQALESLALGLCLLGPIAAPQPALAAVPAGGVPQELREGLFAELGLGGFATAGGRSADGQETLSDPQPYLELALGYDLSPRWSLAALFGLGASSQSCFATVDRRGLCVDRVDVPENQAVGMADSFTVSAFLAAVAYKHRITDRLTLRPRLDLGFAALDPEPKRDQNGRALSSGLALGAGIGLEYATRMDHLAIGVEAAARLVVGPNVLCLAVYPKVKYTF
jgi:hypothetical protein